MITPNIKGIQMTNQNGNFHPSKAASDSHPQSDKYVGLYLGLPTRNTVSVLKLSCKYGTFEYFV